MAKYIIQGETLKAIADEVRDLTDVTDELNPNEMIANMEQANADVAAQAEIIEQIRTALEGKAGSGGSTSPGKEEQEKSITIIENGTTEVTPDEGKILSKVTVNVEVEQNGGEVTLADFLTRKITHVRCESVTEFFRTNMFADQVNLVSADFPNLVRTNDYTFYRCLRLKNVNVPKGNYVGSHAYDGCTSIESLSFPSAATVYTESFRDATKLKVVDIGVTTVFIRTNAFYGCNSFDTLILRGNEVSTLSNINNFNGGAFASEKSGGTIYVPSALIESYKTATNWSVLYEAGRCNFVAIEGSEYE